MSFLGHWRRFRLAAFEMSKGKWVFLRACERLCRGVKRVGVLYNPQVGPFGKLYVQAINEARMAASVGIEAAQVTDTNGMEAFVDSLSPDYEALIVLPDIFTVTHQKAIITKVAQRRLLTMYPFPYFVNVGGIVAYGGRPARFVSSVCIIRR